MSDGATVMLAVAVWIGALVALPVPRWAAILATVVAFALRRPSLLVPAGFLAAASLSAAAWAGLVPPVTTHAGGEAVLLSDPVTVGHAVHIDVRVDGRRVEAWARGSPAAELHDRLAGEVVVVDGWLRAPPDAARDRLAVRHVAARLDIERVGGWRSGSAATRAANEVRRVLARGTESLPFDRRALLSGFLLGDDRELSGPIEADFRAAGLTHLLAVSGQNVAFVMAVAGPLLRRLRLRGRLIGSLAVIAFFAVVTRAEPSVLRASAMAALACWAAFSGRPASRMRILCLAVAGLVLIDPMLPRSVGFQLSVGASLGLALLAGPIAARLGGPRWLAEPLGVTAAAQLGVAPVLITTFGGLPLVTFGANLLAVPVAGPLTAWGLTAGLVAGVVGGPVATLLNLPTGVMVWWIDAVAHAAARVPLGLIGGRDLLVAALAGGAAFALVRRRVAVVVVLAVLLVAAWPTASPIDGHEVARGAHVWRAGATVLVLDAQVDSAKVLDGLNRAGVRRINLVVARRGNKDIAAVILDLRARIPIGSVAAPAGHRIRDATAIVAPVTIVVGRLTVHLEPDGNALDVDL